VLDRQQVPAGQVAAGRVDHGGAGPQGVTAVPGYLDLATAGPAGLVGD
jgi:hypothetical protein